MGAGILRRGKNPSKMKKFQVNDLTPVQSPQAPGSIGSLWPLYMVFVHSGESHAHLGSGYISLYRPRMRNPLYSLNA